MASISSCKTVTNAQQTKQRKAETMNTSAGCLCGKVRFSAPAELNEVGVCHCNICQRWSGGPGFATHPSSAPTIEGKKFVKWYRSSEWAERGFCSECGSNLFYRLNGDEPKYSFFAGAFDDQTKLKLVCQIFIEEKPDYYAFAGDIPSMTGEEVFALFAESGDKD